MHASKAIIIDDEQPARDELRFLLSPHTDIQIVGEADSGPSAIALIRNIQPNIVFLDIQMRGISGYEVAQEIRQIAPASLIIFATAYDDYAMKAFDLGAVDYLLKPFDQERITQTVERIRRIANNESWRTAVEKVDNVLTSKPRLQKIPVLKQGRIALLDFKDISFARTGGGGVEIVSDTAIYEFNGTLSDLEDRFRDASFLRVHKSFIVNLDKIIEVIPWFKGTYWLKMADKAQTQIPVSKMLIKDLKEVLGLH
jgi:DNA-binding LytR/AlgR family response regulator